MNALIFTQISSAASDETKLKGALLKAMKTHDTATVKALAEGGHESIDRDDVLQERIYEYLDAERQREIDAKEKAKADAIAKEKAKTDAVAAQKAAKEKAKADAVAKQNAEIKAAAAAVAAKKAAKDKKKKDALAAKNKAKADAIAKQNAEKKAAAAAKKAKEDKARQAKAAEKKRKDAAAAKKKAAAQKQAKAKKVAPKKKAAPKKSVTAPKVKAAPKAVIAAPVVAVPVAAAAAPLTVSDKKLIGTWKQISSDKVITLVIEEDTNFTLEQVEDDGTLTISGTWKSEENIFMMSIKKVQRNVHSRDTDIHRIYKVERLSKHRLVLRDKRNRIAYDLKH